MLNFRTTNVKQFIIIKKKLIPINNNFWKTYEIRMLLTKFSGDNNFTRSPFERQVEVLDQGSQDHD